MLGGEITHGIGVEFGSVPPLDPSSIGSGRVCSPYLLLSLLLLLHVHEDDLIGGDSRPLFMN